MKRKIFMSLWLTGIIIISAVYIVITIVYYDFFGKQLESQIRIQATVLKYGYENSDDKFDYLNNIKKDLDFIRISIIEPDGNVAFDNFANSNDLSNHLDRPEIIKAVAKGNGEAVRYSNTLNETTYYYALMANDGNIIRAALTISSIWAAFTSTLPFLALLIIFLFMMAAFAAKLLTERIVSPLERLSRNLCGDIDDGMKAISKKSQYDELTPIVEKIKLQNDTIQNQLKIRREFSSNVSHELKTPLTTILGFSELLENDMVKERKDVLRFGGLISKEARRLLSLIDDIITISRLEEMPNDNRAINLNEDIFLNELFHDVYATLSQKAESKGVKVKIIADEKIHLKGSRSLLHQVFYNLLDNAIKYNKDNGSVTLSALNEDNTIIVSVSDTGIGIAPSDIERLFERFYRVDKSRSKSTGGTGLGLSIVKHATELHGGCISIESEINKGTTITIKFNEN